MARNNGMIQFQKGPLCSVNGNFAPPTAPRNSAGRLWLPGVGLARFRLPALRRPAMLRDQGRAQALPRVRLLPPSGFA